MGGTGAMKAARGPPAASVPTATKGTSGSDIEMGLARLTLRWPSSVSETEPAAMVRLVSSGTVSEACTTTTSPHSPGRKGASGRMSPSV